MATLLDQNIQDTYFGLIKTENNCLLTNQTGRINLTDGHGTCSSLSIGKLSESAGIEVNGPLTTTGSATIGGTIDATGQISTTNKICAQDCIDTDKNIVASTGIFANSISIGRDSYGCCLTNPSETIQLNDGNNLRFNFGGSEKGILKNNGDFCVVGVATVGGICSSGAGAFAGDITACNATFNGIIESSGAIRAGADVIAFYSSDKNLKDNLNKIESNNIIDSIDSYEFNWNSKSDRDGKGYGFIAQEVQEVLPHVVKENNNGYLGVDYIQFIPLLVKEIKDLKTRVNELENN